MAADKEHKIQAELIERLHTFYDFHNPSLLEKVFHFVKSPFDHGHEAVIDTSSYTHKNLAEFNERQLVNRTVFGLKKINEFNHHFFTDEERRILSPYPSGFINRSVLWTCCSVNAIIATILFCKRHFNSKALILFGGLFAAEYFIIRTPNAINNWLQGPSRKDLARKYQAVYGNEFFHEIIDPRYDVEKLRHLENKLDTHHH